MNKYLLSLFNVMLIIFLEFGVLKTYSMLPRTGTNLSLIAWGCFSFTIADLLAYSLHYCFHMNRHLYKIIHSIHHEERYPNLLSTSYMHPLEILSFFFIYRAPILVGIPFNQTTFVMYQVILIVWTVCDHSWNHHTFSDHFRHHRYVRGNYATCLQFWDVLFGTKIVYKCDYRRHR